MTDTAPSPRTVIEAFLPFDGDVDLGLVYDTANAAGLEDQPLRLAIRRMITAGEVVQSGRGRGGRLALTPVGRDRLRRDRLALRLAFAQDAGRAPWDGAWRLLAFSVQEDERAVRDSLRRQLVGAGAAPIAPGLYVSPHDLTGMLDTPAHLITATATELNVRGVTDPHTLAEQLWPARPIIDAYAVAESVLATADPDPLVQQLRLAEALEQALRDDPLLPPELRPGPWAPARTRGAWLTAWSARSEDRLYRGWLT
ncbi:PaaX family transcriptional regulator [Actinoplanes sp. NPDC023801]|uniref:PaaX family transcriptional regulator n=1 Tax=Actinoplanes sp. NPDC023801 TaxID=3154595 RepID=UPI0033C0849B